MTAAKNQRNVPAEPAAYRTGQRTWGIAQLLTWVGIQDNVPAGAATSASLHASPPSRLAPVAVAAASVTSRFLIQGPVTPAAAAALRHVSAWRTAAAVWVHHHRHVHVLVAPGVHHHVVSVGAAVVVLAHLSHHVMTHVATHVMCGQHVLMGHQGSTADAILLCCCCLRHCPAIKAACSCAVDV